MTLPDGRKLIGASFRGVAFFVDSGDRSGGRRTVVHEFPLRDDPFVEDLGRRARSFRVDGYVLGDDYISQRDTLLAALEDEAGPGELVHPYHGVRRAICINVSVRESKADGGMATFAIEFAETPTQAPVPTEVVDSAEQVDDSADAAIAAVESELVEQYDAEGLPAFALESAETALAEASEGLASKLAPIVSETQELAVMTGQIALLTAQASSLVRQPANVLGEFRAAITGLAETAAAAPGAVMDALIEAYAVDLGVPVVATTATRARELANQTVLTRSLRLVFAIEAARLAPLVPYTSVEEATAARDQVAAMLEEQAAGAGDTAYPALVSLRSGVLRAVPGGSSFARIVTVTRSVPIPSLLLAYQLYGSVDLESDIIARNSVSNPAFIAGDLKVLGDV
ncbi:MAG TPA: DNA circularization N-terminal domain-containing protein [Gammaproteobacteria bacterium]|nr:DNA circularization N-terminal domain-containing protein [Gammaproteobacteria bacterium]